MTTMQKFWGSMAILLALVVGFWAAEYAGSITQSVWVAAGVGLALALAIGCALGPWREEDAGWLDKLLIEGGVFSNAVAFAVILAIGGFATYLVLDSGPNELGWIDYSEPAGGGFLIGALLIAAWTYAKTRKPDVSYE